MTVVLKHLISLACLTITLFAFLNKDQSKNEMQRLVVHVKKTSINRTSAAVLSAKHQQPKSQTLFTQQNGHRKIHIVNHFSFDATVHSFDFQINSGITNTLVKNMSKYGEYHFLFFKKINPPPPKFC